MPKVGKKTPKTTVNVDAIRREANKMSNESLSQSPSPKFSDGPRGEVAPGSIHRESPLEQEIGTAKYRKMIHNHNSKNKHILDRLPFTFPPKKKVRSHLTIGLQCPECENIIVGSEHTYMAICASCKKLVKPYNSEAEEKGIHKKGSPGIFGIKRP